MIPEAFKRALRPLRRRLRILTGGDLLIHPDLRCAKESHGSPGAGWWIHPLGLEPESIVYAFGVGRDVSFDLSLIERYGVRVHAFDPTPASIIWVRKQEMPAEFILHEYGIAPYDGVATFFPPEQAHYVSHTLLPGTYAARENEAIEVPVRRLASIMAELGHAHIDILKMDIEGAEYRVLEDVLSGDQRIGQILVEFHHRFRSVSLEETRQAVALLKSRGYGLFHVAPNGEEYSFLKRREG